MGVQRQGIRDLESIRERCHVDADTGCWLWSGAMSKPTEPRAWFAAGLFKPPACCVPVRRAAWLLSGRRAGAEQVVYLGADCTDGRCVNPQHSGVGPRGAQARAATRRHDCEFFSAERHARLHRVRLSQALPLERVRAMERALAQGVLQREVAATFGVNKATVNKIAQGRHIHQRPNVIVGASVFSLGLRAGVRR